MSERPIRIGAVVVIALPGHIPFGREQQGVRPAIVVGLPHRLGPPRYPMLLVVPLTTQIGQWAKENPKLYPVIKAGSGGLTYTSVALLDQLRGIDLTRIQGYVGILSTRDQAPVKKGLGCMFGLRAL